LAIFRVSFLSSLNLGPRAPPLFDLASSAFTISPFFCSGARGFFPFPRLICSSSLSYFSHFFRAVPSVPRQNPIPRRSPSRTALQFHIPTHPLVSTRGPIPPFGLYPSSPMGLKVSPLCFPSAALYFSAYPAFSRFFALVPFIFRTFLFPPLSDSSEYFPFFAFKRFPQAQCVPPRGGPVVSFLFTVLTPTLFLFNDTVRSFLGFPLKLADLSPPMAVSYLQTGYALTVPTPSSRHIFSSFSGDF